MNDIRERLAAELATARGKFREAVAVENQRRTQFESIKSSLADAKQKADAAGDAVMVLEIKLEALERDDNERL